MSAHACPEEPPVDQAHVLQGKWLRLQGHAGRHSGRPGWGNQLELAFRRICAGANALHQQLPFELVLIPKASNSTGLQIADLVARSVGIKVPRPMQPNRAYDIVTKRFRRSPAGEMRGLGLKVFPGECEGPPGSPRSPAPTGDFQSNSPKVRSSTPGASTAHHPVLHATTHKALLGQAGVRVHANRPWQPLVGPHTGFVSGCVLLLAVAASAQTLRLPSRPPDAAGGRAFAGSVVPLERAAREERIVAEVLRGNVPAFLRQLVPVTLTHSVRGVAHRLAVWVAPDYLAIGSDEDYFLTPLSSAAAQRIAQAAGCQPPTRRLVDAIHAAAPLKLAPLPIPPSREMVSVPVFARHNERVWEQRQAALELHPLGTLVAGHKKDVVTTPQLAGKPGKVAIYGWHHTNGVPIQPLYPGHADSWVDYSHGIRLVHRIARLDGIDTPLAEIMTDPELSALVSDEGVFPGGDSGRAGPRQHEAPNDWRSSPHFGEQVMDFTLEPGVRIHVNAPGGEALATRRRVHLVLYALPNGNTIEQTIGTRLQPGDDWHFDIQHIGAQTRWLREREKDTALVVACLEASGLSWPAWIRQHGARRLPAYVDRLGALFPGKELTLTLSGHSGGGSFIFGFMDVLERVPANVERIAFLDSNYAYNPSKGHADKLLTWVESSPRNHLCVLAYQDFVALLNGRTFVSESGGTWGRSLAMLADFSRTLPFESMVEDGLQRHTALTGRVTLLLKENPERKILHTVQVERNGFIHSMLTGTAAEGEGYEYLGKRAYEAFIQP